MPVARTLLPPALSHWKYASIQMSADIFVIALRNSLKDFCGFYFLFRELYYISKSNCL